MVTVWPAIADLMTAFLVIAFLTGMVTIAYYNQDDPSSETDTPVDMIDSLGYDSILRQRDSLRTVIDEMILKIDRIGSRSCLGEERENMPNSLMTIRVTPNGYYIDANFILLNALRKQSNEWGELIENIRQYNRQELTKSEMILLGKAVFDLGNIWPSGKCKFSPTLENGGVSPDSLHDAWYKFLDKYFGPLTNPGSLPKYN